MRLCLVEDIAASGLEPLTLTRPVHELLLGATTLASKIARAFGVGQGPQRRGCMIRSHLVAAHRHRDPHTMVNDRDWLGARVRSSSPIADGSRRRASGRFDEHGPWVGLCDGQPALLRWSVRRMPSCWSLQGIGAWFERIAAKYGGTEVGGEVDRSSTGTWSHAMKPTWSATSPRGALAGSRTAT